MEGNHQSPILGMPNPNQSDENEDGSLKDEYFNRELPHGYRFEPTDEELLICYLMRKVKNQPLPPHKIRVVNLHEFFPQELAGKHPFQREDEWFFFSLRNRKYPNGIRPNRGARHGFWKLTGTALGIEVDGIKIGSRKTLDYCAGSYKTHQKTDWKMHEYVLEKESIPPNNKRDRDGMMLNEWVLCKIYKSNRNKESNSGTVQMKPQAVDEGQDVDGSNWQHNDEDIAHLHKPNSMGVRETSLVRSTSTFSEKANQEPKEPEPHFSFPFDPLIYNESGLLQEVITTPFLKNQLPKRYCEPQNNPPLRSYQSPHAEDQDKEGTVTSDIWDTDQLIAHFDEFPNLTSDDWEWLREMLLSTAK